MNNCPQCQAPLGDDDIECPRCGILFSKWKERESNIATGNLSKYSAIANATSSEFNWTILIIVAIAVAGIIFFLAHNAQEALKSI
jgi:uncharacterized membrane protein YvbJ